MFFKIFPNFFEISTKILLKNFISNFCKVRIATMTHTPDDTPHTIFNAISGTRWKVNEVIDFDLKNKNRGLPVCFSL